MGNKDDLCLSREVEFMNQIIKRVIISIVIFIIVFLSGGPIIGWTENDANFKVIFYLSGIIAAGCYWIGSNNKG
jgi:hypothetical protein